MRKPRTSASPKRPLAFEALESRVLFDAAPEQAPAEIIETTEAHPPEPEAALPAEQAPLTELRQVVIIDGGIENVETLVNEFSSRMPNAEIFVLDPTQDGMEQISSLLAGYEGIDALHLVSHGAEGTLQLGTADLNAETMQGKYLDDLKVIGLALSQEGDILIYGCDFTAGESGLEAAMILGGITGADIAASSDATGATILEGDWDLETSIGALENDSLKVESWNGLLTGTPPVLDLDSTDSATVASDNLSSNTATGGTGWSTDWTKIVDADGNDIRFTGGTLVLRDPDNLVDVRRSVNLSGYRDPTLSFTYNTSGNLANTDTYQFEYSTNGGGSWTVLAALSNDPVGGPISVSYSLGSVGSATTVFRARFTGGSNDNTKQVILDNFVVSGSLPNYSTNYLTNATPVAITSSNVGITDGDDTTMKSASITLTNAKAGDLLQVVGVLPGSIVASAYNPGTGVITLTGTDTKANYESAIEKLFFSSTSSVAGDRVLNIVVNDGTGNSNTAVSTITVALESDADGVADSIDIDDDNDGILDQNEMVLVTSAPVTSTLTYDAAASAAAPLVNGQRPIILTDGTITVTITNDFGATISGAVVNTDSSSGTAESVRVTATSPTGSVFIQGLVFSDLDDFDPTQFVDALALDQLGTWSNLGNSDGINKLYSYSNDAAGEAAATTATAEPVSFADLRSRGALSPVLLNPASATQDNYRATFTLTTPTSTFLVFGTDVVTPMDQVTYFTFNTLPITYTIQSYQDIDTDGDGIVNRLDIDSDNDGITDNVEAQATAAYINRSGSDLDGDGLDDNYDANDANTSVSASIGLLPVDTDSDGTKDYLDSDSDNDGISDIIERGDGAPTSVTSTTDTDHDGLLDIFEASNVNDGYDSNDENLTGSNFNLAKSPTLNADGSNAIPLVRDLLFRKPNQAPVGVNDTGTAVEAGGTANGTPGSNASGNVLTNDTDADTGSAGLTVTAVRTGATEGVGTAGTLGSALAGTYGSLTINANGTYSYAIDNSNATVQALAVGQTLTDSFNYTLSDGSLTDTAVLAITIQGRNDAPSIDFDVDDSEGTGGADFAATFTEGTPPVSISDTLDTQITDVDDTAMSSMTWTLAAILDGDLEILSINGTDFPLGTTTGSPVSVIAGATTFAITYNSATGVFAFANNSAGDMPVNDLRTLIASTTYRNESLLPSLGNRILSATVNDGDAVSNTATTTLSVVRDAESTAWSISGSSSVIEGSSATYTISLSNAIRAGETASVAIGLTDLDTTGADHDTLNTALVLAVSDYNASPAPGTLAWDGTTLTFTSDGSGVIDAALRFLGDNR
ncbi:MAG: DUF4347 domain-containing protein [Verrucomicrobiales bacterium]